MKPSLIVYAEYLNLIQNVLTSEQFYKLAYKLIPKQKNGYIKYIKKINKKTKINLTDEEINSNNISSLLFEL